MNPYLLVIVVSVCLAYALECLSGWLTIRHLSPELPREFEDILDRENHATSRLYTASRMRLEMVEGGWSLLLLLAAIHFALFNEWDQFLRQLVHDELFRGLIYLGSLGLVASLLGLPFRLYSTFVIEERFGFNKTTLKTFILDRIKGTILAMLIGGPLVAAILWFFQQTGSLAWLYAWGATVLIMLAIQYLAPEYILPLFNTFTPMEDGELKNAIDTFAGKQNFALSGIFVIDGSRRSTKSNAYFTGFGRKKRIALFDTMIRRHPVEEIVGVLAHEVGHSRLGHLKKMMAASVVKSGAIFFLLSLALSREGMYQAFGIERMSVYTGLVVFSFLLTPLTLFLAPLFNAISRRYERQADDYAARTTGNPTGLAEALKKLGRDNYANLTPHPLNVILHYSHPPLLERVRRLTGTQA